MGMRAGKSQPARRKAAAQTIAVESSCGVTEKAKATWLKVCQLMVDALKPSKKPDAINAPDVPRWDAFDTLFHSVMMHHGAPYVFFFGGRPTGRMEAMRPRRVAVCFCQVSLP